MVSKSFKAHELVPEHIYRHYKEMSWKFINPKLIITIDLLKDHFNLGTMTINNYFWGGSRKWSGWRTPKSEYYSETSQHSLGNAVDIVFSHYSAEEVRNYIIDNPHIFPYIKGIELGVEWVHIDVRNTDYVIIFKKD